MIGGKNGAGVYQYIINAIPKHDRFIELFAGSGAIARHMKGCDSTILVDRDLSMLEAVSVPAASKICCDALYFLDCLNSYAGQETFIYVDPPYLMSVRACRRRYYRYDAGDPEFHKSLLARLNVSRANIMLSGYWSTEYVTWLRSGWRVLVYPAVKRSGDVVEEVLWLNYPEGLPVHDISYTGLNFTDRQRIKRKRVRHGYTGQQLDLF